MKVNGSRLKAGHILALGGALALALAACAPGAGTTSTASPLGTEGGLSTSAATSDLSGTSAATSGVSGTSAATSVSTELSTSIATQAATSAATEGGTSSASTQVGTSSASTQVGTSAASTEVGTSAASTQVGTSAASTQVGTSSAATQVGTANATAGATTEANLPLLIQSDKLIGMSIQDNTGTSLGQISDVFVDISGTVQAVALNMSATGTPSASSTQNGSATQSSTQSATSAATSAATSSAATTGTPNTTGNAVFVPWTDIKADVNTQALVYNGSMTTLSSLPAYNASQFSSGYVLRSTGTGTSTSLPSQYEGLIRLGAPNNVKLQTTSNDTVGTLQNVIVDMNSGKATYAAVDVSTFVGATNDVVLVPWTMFKLDNTSGSSNTSMTPVIRLNVTKSSLQNAPKFDATSLSLWPTPAQPTWDNQIKLFWQTSGV